MHTLKMNFGEGSPHELPTRRGIEERAYQLFRARGQEAGHDQEDWLQAEREIISAMGEYQAQQRYDEFRWWARNTGAAEPSTRH